MSEKPPPTWQQSLLDRYRRGEMTEEEFVKLMREWGRSITQSGVKR